jgi:hypothetical protein
MWHVLDRRKVQIGLCLENLKERTWWTVKSLLGGKFFSSRLDYIYVALDRDKWPSVLNQVD